MVVLGASLTQGVNAQKFEALAYILGWYFFSLSISIYNKWMFGEGLEFKYPVIITSFHQLCLMVLSYSVLYMKPRLWPVSSYQVTEGGLTGMVQFIKVFKMDLAKYAISILPCATVSAADIGLSNVSFKFISLSLYTMLKTSSLVFVLVFGLLFKLERFHWRLIVIVIVMTLSVLMMSKKPDNLENVSNENDNLGILIVLSASVMSGLRWSFTQILLKHNVQTNNSITTIFYLSPVMCLILFTMGLIFEGWGNFISSPIWEVKGTLQSIFLLIVPGVLAFLMTLCEFKLLSVAQVITLSVAGIFKELLTIILSTIIFGDQLSWLNYLGLMITFLDILWYNYFRYHESNNEVEYAKLKTDEEDIELH